MHICLGLRQSLVVALLGQLQQRVEGGWRCKLAVLGLHGAHDVLELHLAGGAANVLGKRLLMRLLLCTIIVTVQVRTSASWRVAWTWLYVKSTR